MRFTQLSLNDYIPLTDSAITLLTVKYTSDVQITIGTNGSGKSSYSRQLSPYPAPRSIFGKQGFKALTIEKDGETFRLESEYQKSSSPHAFYNVDTNENLNVGRTTETQKELIVEHLGITPFVDDLIMNRISFPTMLTSKRKEFLMAHNPSDIGFVLGLIKQNASKIKACKNNLNRLQSRKILLEQDLLSPENVLELETERKQIEEDLRFFQQQLMTIEVGLRSTPATSLSDQDYRALTKTLRSVRYKLIDLTDVDRNDGKRSQERDRLVGEIASYAHQIEQANNDLIAQNKELNDLETRYLELAPDGDLREVESTITRLEIARDSLQTHDPEFSGTKDDIDKLYQQLDIIGDRLKIFERCEVPLYSRVKRSRRERMRDLIGYRRNSYNLTLQDLRSQYQEMQKRHTLSPRDIPDAPCAKNACPLYSHFMEEYDHAEQRRDDIETRGNKVKRKLERIERYLTASDLYFTNSQMFHDTINWLIDQSQHNPILHRVLRSLDLLTTLKTGPNRIILRLKEAYDQIEQWFRYKSVLSDLETAYALKRRFMGSQNEDTVKLVVSIESLRKSLSALRIGLDKASDNRKVSQTKLDHILLYDQLKTQVLHIEQAHQAYSKLRFEGHERSTLFFLKDKVEALQNQSFLRMSEVERTLRAQSGLKERYQEEVVSQITVIEKELRDLEQIEKALIAIPRENIIAFVNGIFDQANRLIASIWTVPFKIELLKEDDVLDYSFMVSGDNQSIREMNECSEGQTEILSLAINLALRIQLGHLNLPLCLDEPARTFDDEHRRRMISLLRLLLDDKIISQLFVISHHASFHEGLHDAETFVVREDNILVPQSYNEHVTMV